MPQDGLKIAPRALLAAHGRSWTALGPLLAALGRSWLAPGASWGDLGAILGRSWAVLGRSWGDLGRPREVEQFGGRRCSREAGHPLETFCESLLRKLRILRDVQQEIFTRDSQHTVLRWGRRIEERFARPPPPPSVFDRFESAFGFCDDQCG